MTSARANLLTLVLSILIALGLAEILLRFLPVNSGLGAQPVDAQSPVFRFAPDQDFVWSKGGLFELVNRGHVNNAGFVNDQDYRADGAPLLAVIGDSYVEAAMVPYGETLQGRLAASLGPSTRVYSFGASGAPLSQYLIWARHARRAFGAQRMIFVVVGNDFDESHIAYKKAPGFHHYAKGGDEALSLVRIDYHPEAWRRIVRRSALARYLFLNLHLDTLPWRGRPPHPATDFFGHTRGEAPPERMAAAEGAIAAFLGDLPAYSGLAPDRILFLVDGFRYPPADPNEAMRRRSSFFHIARQRFLQAARSGGYEAIDLDEYFFATPGQAFEFATDGHWNGQGHALAHRAASTSRLHRSLNTK
jgi:hypothetical protein